MNLLFFETESVFLLAKGVDADSNNAIAPIIVDTATNFIIEHKIDKSNSLLETAFIYTNQKVRQTSKDGSGACLLGIHLKNNKITISHVGDNRVYLIRNGILGQITIDQNLYSQQIQTDSVQNDFWSRRVTLQAICANLELYPDILNLKLLEGDNLILATDGIWSNVTDKNQGLVYRDEVVMNELFTRVFNEKSDGERNQNITNFLADKTSFEDVTLILIEVKS